MQTGSKTSNTFFSTLYMYIAIGYDRYIHAAGSKMGVNLVYIHVALPLHVSSFSPFILFQIINKTEANLYSYYGLELYIN